MPGTLRFARRRAPAAVLLVASAMLLGTAVPGSAGSAKSTTYAANWSFSGDVQASLTARPSSVSLADYSPEYYDRATATPGKSERVTISGVLCPAASYFQSGVSLFAEPSNWANMPVDGIARPGRVKIGCIVNGATHH
ncbi:MAG TPA: hypothetical protein VNA12_06560, partial [Mycobacteriales bacterium]|nr:hypothetical protein [Mycobacteriales bacterium]